MVKLILSSLFAIVLFTAQAQTKETQTAVDTVKVPLTEWQEKQLLAIEQQKKTLDEQAKFIITAIADFHKVDQTKITGIDYKPGKLIFVVKKK